ncbi:MAG: CoB--CoM heterodisulfide reductase iron-sulfur subunit B family protein [Thermodesulfobacteriota bacterium]
MNVTYYPGCSLESSARDYDESIRTVCGALDIDLQEPENWTCCGATSAHSLNDRLALDLPARNFTEMERMGQDLLVPCPLCYNRLIRAKVETQSGIPIYDMATFMAQPALLEKIKSAVKIPLKTLSAVCYYGCMANRPPKITGSKNYENPMEMDQIAQTLGVEVKPWSFKTDCCGASFSISKPEIIQTLVRKLYDRALEAGAECIIVSCQMCQANLDLYQKEISGLFKKDYQLPVFYFTELIGLALGLKDIWRGLKRHRVDPLPYLREKGLIAG